MDIKRILLPEKVETDEKLYYRRSGGVTVEKDGVLCVPKDGQVEFNTYFNGFSSGKWKSTPHWSSFPWLFACRGISASPLGFTGWKRERLDKGSDRGERFRGKAGAVPFSFRGASQRRDVFLLLPQYAGRKPHFGRKVFRGASGSGESGY